MIVVPMRARGPFTKLSTLPPLLISRAARSPAESGAQVEREPSWGPGVHVIWKRVQLDLLLVQSEGLKAVPFYPGPPLLRMFL
eukprot:scaffold215425_cov16-Prasinocladus_malaysianus.AAC.2